MIEYPLSDYKRDITKLRRIDPDGNRDLGYYLDLLDFVFLLSFRCPLAYPIKTYSLLYIPLVLLLSFRYSTVVMLSAVRV